MRILLTNDDGWFAPGLQALCRRLSQQHEVVVVAPDRNRSGASHSLTLQQSIIAHQHADNVWAVEGTPVDCVHYALGVLYPQLGCGEPDLVVSGMNNGANMGDDTLYSGTVAGAMEGRHLALPNVAVSVAARQPQHWSEAANTAAAIVDWVADLSSQSPIDGLSTRVFNVNIPDCSADELLGWQVTRLGARSRWQPPQALRDPRGREVYWLGVAGDVQDVEHGHQSMGEQATMDEQKTMDEQSRMTDFAAVQAGYVSITPLHTDLTYTSQLAALDQQLPRDLGASSNA